MHLRHAMLRVCALQIGNAAMPIGMGLWMMSGVPFAASMVFNILREPAFMHDSITIVTRRMQVRHYKNSIRLH